MSSNKFKRWTFTLNNFTDKDLNSLQNLSPEPKFIIYGKELASTGTPHLQGYIEFTSQRTMTAVKKSIGNPTVHLEKAIADARTNVLYCSKGEQSHEEYTTQGKDGTNYGLNADVYSNGSYTQQGQRTDLESINNLIKTHTIKELIDEGKIKNTQQIRFAEACMAFNTKPRMTAPRVVWICGDTGTGKTHYVFSNHDNEDIHSQNSFKFWDGYNNQPVVLIDDMRADFCKYHELLKLLDKYPHRVEVKCGDRIFNSSTIYITSPYTPAQMFKSKTDEDLVQLTRRIDELHIIKKDTKYISYPKEKFNKLKKWSNLTIIDEKTSPVKEGEVFMSGYDAEPWFESEDDSIDITDDETEYQQGVSPPPTPPTVYKNKTKHKSSIRWNFEEVQPPVSPPPWKPPSEA